MKDLKTYHYEDPQFEQEVQTLFDAVQDAQAQAVLSATSLHSSVTRKLHAFAGFSAADQVAAARELTIKIRDLTGSPVSYSVATLWMSSSEHGAPASLTGSYTLTSGVEIIPRSGYLATQVMTDAYGKIVMEVTPGAGSWHFMISSGPFLASSGAITWT